MKQLILVSLLAITLAACASQSPQTYTWNPAPGPYTVAHLDELKIYDPAQERDIPMQVSYPSAGPAAPEGFPVVVFSHGAFCYPEQYRNVTDHWVSHGYAVIFLDHPDSPNLGKINPKVLFTLLPMRAAEISFAADSVTTIQEQLPGLAGTLDGERLAVSGHSFGGMMSEIIMGAPIVSRKGELQDFSDERFMAAVILSGVGPAPLIDKSELTEDAFDSIRGPLFASGGTLDTGNVGTPVEYPWEWRMSPYSLTKPGDKFALELQNSDHYLGGLICRTDRGGEDDYEGLEIVSTLNTAFLDAYVKGDSAALEFLNTADVPAITDGRAVLKRK